MSRHTPGPWGCYRVSDGWEVEADGYRVAKVHDINGWPQNASNSDLIAAAPDLLASVDALLEVAIQAIESGDWKVDGACDPDMALKQDRAAIAKATGESA